MQKIDDLENDTPVTQCFNCHRFVDEAVQYKKFSRSLPWDRENKCLSDDNWCSL